MSRTSSGDLGGCLVQEVTASPRRHRVVGYGRLDGRVDALIWSFVDEVPWSGPSTESHQAVVSHALEGGTFQPSCRRYARPRGPRYLNFARQEAGWLAQEQEKKDSSSDGDGYDAEESMIVA